MDLPAEEDGERVGEADDGGEQFDWEISEYVCGHICTAWEEDVKEIRKDVRVFWTVEKGKLAMLRRWAEKEICSDLIPNRASHVCRPTCIYYYA